MSDRLIVFVSQHPVLFDKREKDYKNNDVRDMIWKDIADQLGHEDVDEVKRLWRNLRDTYVRKKREEMDVRSGQTVKKKKKWKFMDAMSFMEETISCKRVHGNLENNEEEQDHGENAGQIKRESEGETDDTANSSESFICIHCNKKKKRDSGDVVQEYLERKKEQQRAKEHEDENTMFLLSLVPSMKRLPVERQSWVRLKIQELLHEAQFGHL